MAKYNWNYWSSYFKGGLKKSAKYEYYSIIKSEYEDYYHEHHDDQYYIISKKSCSSSSFKETSTTNTTTTTTTALPSSSSDINNKNNVGEELEWMLVIFVCDDYGEEPIKRYDVPLRYISSSPVFKALVRSCGHKFGAIVSQGWVVLPCSIRFFESVHNLAMCQAKEEEEENAKSKGMDQNQGFQQLNSYCFV